MNKLNGIILTLGLWLVLCGTATATQLYVNDSGWWQEGGAFNTSSTPIQAAVDAAREGDSIYVWNGTYYEDGGVSITKERITLQGEDANTTTIHERWTAMKVVQVTGDYVNVSGFTVAGSASGGYGIYVNADYCTISDNIASSNYYGIYLYSSSNNNTLTSNTADSNGDYGIYLSSSSNNTLTSNTASNNRYGIYLSSSSNNTLTSNTASNNRYYGIYIGHSSNNTLENNNCSNNRYGICLYKADNNNITCNWVHHNIWGGFYLTSGITGNNINYNNIIENGNYNTVTGGWEWQFYMGQYQPVEAKHNCWGAGMNNSTIDASIYDDEEGWGEVEFYPFEIEPVPCAPGPKRPAFTTTDAVIALQIAAGSRPSDLCYDVSGDGSVTSLDALMILQAAVT